MVLISKAFNTLHFGTPHESFSQKVARKVIIEKSESFYWSFWAWLINFIFSRWQFREENHLLDALDGENRSFDLEKYWDK